jgi:hypothetical protein
MPEAKDPILAMFELYLATAEKVSDRRAQANAWMLSVNSAMRWTRKFGQEVKLSLLLRRTDLNDGQTEAIFGGFQGEGCS